MFPGISSETHTRPRRERDKSENCIISAFTTICDEPTMFNVVISGNRKIFRGWYFTLKKRYKGCIDFQSDEKLVEWHYITPRVVAKSLPEVVGGSLVVERTTIGYPGWRVSALTLSMASWTHWKNIWIW